MREDVKKSRLLELFCEKICEDEKLKKFGLSKDNIVLEYNKEEFEDIKNSGGEFIRIEGFFECLEQYSVLITGKPMCQHTLYDFCREIREFENLYNRYTVRFRSVFQNLYNRYTWRFRGVSIDYAIKYSLHLTTKEQYEEIDKIKNLIDRWVKNFIQIAFPYEEVKEEEEEQSSVKEEEQSSVKEEEPKPVQPNDGEGSYSTPLALFIFGVCSIFFCLYYYA